MLKHSPFSGPKSITSAAPVLPPTPEPTDAETYPILATLGYENWPEAASFEALPTPVQFAWAAHWGVSNLAVQKQDFFVIGTQTTPSPNQSGSWHGAAATNHSFHSHYYEGPGQHTHSRTQIDASWQAYLNWLLGVDDGNSHGSWDGTEADIESYKYWYVHSRKLAFNAVPHNGW